LAEHPIVHPALARPYAFNAHTVGRSKRSGEPRKGCFPDGDYWPPNV